MCKNKELSSKVTTALSALKKGKERTFTFLLIGRTGVGKSSTINTLLGEDVATVGNYRPETQEVQKYRKTINGVTFDVVDAPGLCDDLPEKGNDTNYLKKIQAEVSTIDCLWFVTRLHDYVYADEMRAIQLISEVFGKEVWHHAIIVFTYADVVDPEEYQEALRIRTESIRETVKAMSPKGTRYRSIASVAVSNTQDILDNKRWLSELYVTIFKSIGRTSLIPFYLGTAARLVTEKKKSEPNIEKKKSEPNIEKKKSEPNIKTQNEEILLDTKNEQDMKDRLTDDPVLRIFTRAGISTILGTIGTAIGGIPGGILTGAIGTAITFIMDLFND